MRDFKGEQSGQEGKKKILIVDDDPNILKIYQIVVHNAGFLVDIAHNGVEAFLAIEEFNPDLILLDLMMPEMDGYDALTKMRNMPKMADIPIIVFTNKNIDRDKEWVMKHGATDVMIKANTLPQELVDKINSLL